MPEFIENPSRVEAAGTKPKLIDEFAGRASTSVERVSVARMRSPAWGARPRTVSPKVTVPASASST